jgi:hypothetical protein
MNTECIAAHRTRRVAVTSQRLTDCCDHLFIRRKHTGVLLRHGLLTDPYRELTTSTLDDLGVDPGFPPDKRRHTGRAGTIVSNLAISNADALHGTSLLIE